MVNPNETTDQNSRRTNSVATAMQDILTWSADCPGWQRDALRRLCAKSELNDTDLDELTILCKNKGEGEPLSAEHIHNPESAATVVNLLAIRDIENVNALPKGEHLSFCKTGLTAVYGDNGSGKSGYVRILKKACRARVPPKEETILPNIYSTNPGPPRAVIKFTAGGQNDTHNWSDQAIDPRLSSISVFDSHTASIHVDGKNDVAYTPFPMQVLEKLAETCRTIKEHINAEIENLDGQKPSAITNQRCSTETRVGKLIQGLNGNTNKQDVLRLATMDGEGKSRLDNLRNDLKSDPDKTANKLDVLKKKMNDFYAKFEELRNILEEKQIKHLVALHQDYTSAKEAAAAAAKNIFTNDPLPEIGSEVWRKLWDAARHYSEQYAYPDTPFPFTDNAARCVLCQQELSQDAVDRLRRFDHFVKDETKRREDVAAMAYRNAYDALVDKDISLSDMEEMIKLIHNELDDVALEKSVRQAVLMAKWRLRAIRQKHTCGENVRYPEVASWPTEAFITHTNNLSERITALRASGESEERKKMKSQLAEMEDREWLNNVKDDVFREIKRLKKLGMLQESIDDTATHRITKKSSEIAKNLVTRALQTQFSEEVQKMGISGLKVELRKETSSYGVPRFRVSLIQKPEQSAGKILSEGEHRCVALAAFLAELITADSRSAIVFDDPISSLDHLNRKAVANRLAEEAQCRQVIVLTHDIAFLSLLQQACRSKSVNLACCSVSRNDDYAGFVQKNLPLNAQSAKDAIQSIQNRLNKEKYAYEKGKRDKWVNTVDSLCNQLRRTWECAVEEAVEPVLNRFSNKVDTTGLVKVTVLKIEDCDKMRDAYGRCAILLHSTASHLNSPLPKPTDIQKEITALKEWIDDISGRQQKIR